MLKKSASVPVFFGLPVADHYILRLQKEVITTFPELDKQVRWVRPGNHHVTLRFIGNIPKQKLTFLFDSVMAQMAGISDLSPISINITKIARFPNKKSKLIAAFVEFNTRLQQLYDAAELGVTFVGVSPEHRAYKPHITLCRSRSERKLHMTPIVLNNFKIDISQLVLFESVSEVGGNRYIPLFKKSLIGAK